MNKFSIAALRVISMLMVPIGALLWLLTIISGQQQVREMTPFQAFMLVFFGLLGIVVCDIAEK